MEYQQVNHHNGNTLAAADKPTTKVPWSSKLKVEGHKVFKSVGVSIADGTNNSNLQQHHQQLRRSSHPINLA